jgi:hypothetical protein
MYGEEAESKKKLLEENPGEPLEEEIESDDSDTPNERFYGKDATKIT